MITPRPYQVEATQASLKSLNAHGKSLVVMATGLGKTTVFGEVARYFSKVLIMAHRKELIEQAEKRMKEQLQKAVGVEMASLKSNGEDITVASVQTLAARDFVWQPDLIVVDEAHHAVSPTYQKVLSKYPNAKVLGVTATADRTDGIALGSYFKHVAYRYETKDAIRDKWLVPVVPVRVYGIENLKQAVDARKTIIFTPNVARAIEVAGLIGGHFVHGEMAKKQRERVINAFKAGEFQFMVNCNVLTEGFDCPDIECVAMLRATESRSLFTQCLGRGLRLADDKRDCLYIDLTLKMPDHSLVGPRDALGGVYKELDMLSKALSWWSTL